MRISPSLCVCGSTLLQGLTFAYVWVCVCGCVSACVSHGCYRAVSGLPSDLSLCSVLQCVAVCCSVWCVAVRSVSQCVVAGTPLSLSLSVYGFNAAAGATGSGMCCSVLQCVVCCSASCVAVSCRRYPSLSLSLYIYMGQYYCRSWRWHVHMCGSFWSLCVCVCVCVSRVGVRLCVCVCHRCYRVSSTGTPRASQYNARAPSAPCAVEWMSSSSPRGVSKGAGSLRPSSRAAVSSFCRVCSTRCPRENETDEVWD